MVLANRSSVVSSLVLVWALLAYGSAIADPPTLVVAAPGYPSNTVEAQPTMDQLARALEQAAELASGSLRVVYHPRLDAGLAALRDPATVLALVPLPLYLAHGEELGLGPVLAVSENGAVDQTWSLVARRGTVAGPIALDGWELAGLPGYAPDFVRRVALGDWGSLPESTRVVPSSHVLSMLRRSAKGEPVAVLLDRSQVAALPQLTFGTDLEVVHASQPVPGNLICTVGNRLDEAERRALVDGLASLASLDGNAELMKTLGVDAFRPLVDSKRLAALARLHAGEHAPGS